MRGQLNKRLKTIEINADDGKTALNEAIQFVQFVLELLLLL